MTAPEADRERMRERAGGQRSPRWPWLIGLLAAIWWWWPFDAYWLSDDFIAVHHTASFPRTLQDFVGAQYGVDGLVSFYRPLISLSFALDQLFGSLLGALFGAAAVSHTSNVLAHAGSTVVLAFLLRRFVPPRIADASALVWAFSPSHAGSVYWAVGRVDSHTTFWLVLAALLFVQWWAGERRSRRGALLCAALALGSKELAVVFPGIALVLGLVLAPAGTAVGQRARAALRGAWPFIVLVGVYLLWRRLVLGVFVGGYEAELQPVAALSGLAVRTAQLLDPLLQGGQLAFAALDLTVSTWLLYLGALPAVTGIAVLVWRRRFALLATVALLYVGCALPIVQLWADTENPMNLRNFYLPMMPLALLLGAGGFWTAGPALLVCLLPLLDATLMYALSWEDSRGHHAALLGSEVAGPCFVAGLERSSPAGKAPLFHLGVDRLLQAPFTDRPRPVYALRPVSRHAQAFTLPDGAERGLPFGTTLHLQAEGEDGLTITAAVVPPDTGPEALTCQWVGAGRRGLTLPILDRMVQNHLARQRGAAVQGEDPALVVLGVRSARFRVTLFTASGYLTTFVADGAAPGAANGRLELGALLAGAVDAAGGQRVGDLLQVATAIDLLKRFPMLIEAAVGSGGIVPVDGNTERFTPTHWNVALAWLEMPEGFADWWP